MSNPLVSIITPAYNAERTIAETIGSVRAQNFTDWEMIIVDDGSTDDTAAIVRALQATDPRIRLYTLPRNTGLAAAARNHAMKRARGEFIAFLDADDLWEPNKLSSQVDYLRQHSDVDVLSTWHEPFGDPERARQWRTTMWRFSTTRVTLEQSLQQSLTTSSVMMRRRCFEKLGGMIANRRLTTGEDTEYWIRLVAHHETHRLCEPLTRYRVHVAGGSLSMTDLQRKHERDRTLLRVMLSRSYLTPSDKLLYRSIYHYNRARDALFTTGGPFRGDILRAVATGRAPLKAWVLAALCWLPAPALRGVLRVLLRVINPAS